MGKLDISGSSQIVGGIVVLRELLTVRRSKKPVM
jgi:hypothetical protein